MSNAVKILDAIFSNLGKGLALSAKEERLRQKQEYEQRMQEFEFQQQQQQMMMGSYPYLQTEISMLKNQLNYEVQRRNQVENELRDTQNTVMVLQQNNDSLRRDNDELKEQVDELLRKNALLGETLQQAENWIKEHSKQ